MLDPDMAAAKALAEAKKKQRDATITKGIKSIGALGVDPSLVKLQLLSVKRGCVPGKELWYQTSMYRYFRGMPKRTNYHEG